jgi:hypothetical protein
MPPNGRSPLWLFTPRKLEQIVLSIHAGNMEGLIQVVHSRLPEASYLKEVVSEPPNAFIVHFILKMIRTTWAMQGRPRRANPKKQE